MSMFSVDINSAGGANYIQPKKGAKPRVASPRVPVDMTKTGSLFNDPKIFTTEGTTPTLPQTGVFGKHSVQGQRGGHSIFNGQMNFVSGGTTTSGGPNQLVLPTAPGVNPETSGGDDLGIGRDAGKGRAAAKELKAQTNDLKGQIGDVENSGDDAKILGQKGKKLKITLDKNDDKFKQSILKQREELEKIELERKSEIQIMNSAKKSLEQYNNELEAELANPDQNIDRIMTLRSHIREQSTTITVGNQRVNVLGRSSKALAAQLNKTSNAYIKTNKATQKDLNENSSKLEKTLEVATEIEEISTLVESIGGTIESLGKIFKACAAIPYVGAALAAAGAVMEPIGATGKAVGQWGKTAAQITKTIAYASDGQIAMAFQSAACAVQSGMSAVASTKQAVGEFKELDAEFAEIKADASAAEAARAESKAAKAEEKLMKKAEKAGVDQETLDKLGTEDGPEIKPGSQEEKLLNAKNKADGLQKEATGLRNNADTKMLDANYERAKLELKQQGGTAEDLAKLDAEYKGLKENGIKGSKSDLLKGTSVDKNGEITKKAAANTKKRADAFAKKKADERAKSVLKQLFSKEGGVMMAKALTVAGSIAGMIEASNAQPAHAQKPKQVQISARAQKIVAQTMSKMSYTRPATRRWA